MKALKKLGSSGGSVASGLKKAQTKPDVTGPAKIGEVSELLQQLKTDLSTKEMTAQQRLVTLSRLKVLGREEEGSDPIFTKDGIETLARASLDDEESSPAAREGLRCLANALLLKQETRQFFVDGGFSGKVAELLKKENLEDQFLAGRLLFLLTYDTDLDFEALNTEHQLCATINEVPPLFPRIVAQLTSQCISNDAKLHLKRSRKTLRPKAELDALTEVLKLLFNLTHHYASLCTPFDPSAPNLLRLLLRETKTVPEPRPILQAPTLYLINALLNLTLPPKPIDTKSDIESLINLLDAAIQQYPLAQLDASLAPLLALLRRAHEDGPDPVRRYAAWLLLPTPDERAQPLGTSETLSARLLRLSVAPAAPNLKEPISALLFELSDKDVDTFVANIGYGFAAGFLASHDVPAPSAAGGGGGGAGSPKATQADSDAILHGGKGAPGAQQDVVEGEGGEKRSPGPEEVNFVTGQYLVDEPAVEEEPMSEDEKLREAERLFTLFERLKATGVVDVRNPVEVAASEGRLEELPD